MTITSNRTALWTRPSAAVLAGAGLAALGFVVEGAITLFHHTGEDHWDGLSQALNAAYAIAVLAMIVALPGLGRWLSVGRTGRVAVVIAQLGCLAMAAESAVSGAQGGNTLGGLFFGGLVLTVLGLLAVGVSGIVAGRHRSFALLPFLGLVIGILGGEHGGGIVTGIVWASLGVLWVRPES